MNVFVWGWGFYIYETTGESVYKAIKDLTANEKNVNFHVYSPDQFEALSLTAIKKIKSEKVDSNITTTYIARDEVSISFEEIKRRCILSGIDDVVLYPESYVSAHTRHSFKKQRENMRKWAYSFVDTVFVCFYPTLNFHELEELATLKALNINVVNMYNKQIEERLKGLLSELDPLELKLYNDTRRKIPFSVIAEGTGLTGTLMGELYYSAIFHLIQAYQKKYGNLL